jgi:hypothetical protein
MFSCDGSDAAESPTRHEPGALLLTNQQPVMRVVIRSECMSRRLPNQTGIAGWLSVQMVMAALKNMMDMQVCMRLW